MEQSVVYEFINFTPVVTIIFLLVFMRTNDMFEKKISDIFNLAIASTILLLVVGNARLLTHDKAQWLLPVDIELRVIVMLAISLIMVRRIMFKYKHIIMHAPAVIGLIFMLLAIFVSPDLRTGISVMGYIYLIGMLAAIGYNVYMQIYDEVLMCSGIVVILFYSIIFDAKDKYMHNMFWASVMLSLAFFYMYFHAQSFKRDVLTGVLNRRCFYADAKRYELKISALMSIDLNNLKTLNDTKGHAEGDKAIVTMTNNVRRALPRDCYMYRTGGDEFMAIFTKTDMETVRITKDIVKDNMAKTPYS